MQDALEESDQEFDWDAYVKMLTDRLNNVTHEYSLARKFIYQHELGAEFTAVLVANRMEGK